MFIEQEESLAEWIKNRIVEICDAEPDAFGKYVLALLKKDSSEKKLREICEEQLNVFLGSNTKEFVDALFDVLNTQSYVTSPQKFQFKETVSDKNNSQDSFDKNDSRDLSNSSQEIELGSSSRSLRPRISPPRDRDSRFKDSDRRRSRSRSPHRRDYNRRERFDRNTSFASRARCRDYEEKGFCSKGDKCLYDHGPNPIVLDSEFSANPPPGVDVKPSTVEEYNFETPSTNTLSTSNITAFMPNFSVPPPGFVQQIKYVQPQQNLVPVQQSGFVRGRGRGRGSRYGFGERVQPNKSSSIEVRRIPPEVNKLGVIHKHFEQYGDITNIQIGFDGQKDTALVTYSRLIDAQAAMKSQKPILDNRFIQVAWHKSTPSSAETKTEQDFSSGDIQPDIPLAAEPQTETAQSIQKLAEEKMQARHNERQMQEHLKKIHMLKTQLYEKQVKEMKGLYERISVATDTKVKIQLASMINKLDDALKELTKEIHELHEQIQKSDKSSGDSLDVKEADMPEGKDQSEKVE